MAQSKQAIKSRIDSVDSTRKITNAMQLVASAKLNRARQEMEQNREYSRSLLELLAMVLERTGPGDPMRRENTSLPSYVFVITSDMGLCGAYNGNIFRSALNDLNPDDQIFIIGSRGAAWAKARGLKLDGEISDLNDDTAYMNLASAMDRALALYKAGKVGSIKVLYTHYKNTLTFVPTLESLIPPEVPKMDDHDKKVAVSTIFEPKRSTMLEEIVPMASKNLLYSRYLESKTSEQASRRMAMETATDNADELMEDLNLQYNRVRQSAITQEITEIVSGANALA